LHLAAGVAALPAVSRIARAQSYPTRLIRLLVPFPRAARSTPSVVLGGQDENHAGLGHCRKHGWRRQFARAAAVAHARPDGYTLLLGGSIPHVTESILKTRPFVRRDQRPGADLKHCRLGFAITVHPSVPAHTLKELVDYAKGDPGKLSYGSPGVGTLPT
jgi:hypothetical protein